ncbi:MAG: SGNH/GDSL hydrolase family protein [Clostridia bacterium]|nr:SGNH/GDSL hydrolase family protein [Clostridia bacterium]
MLKRIVCCFLAMLLIMGGCTAMGENFYFSNAEQVEWYQDMLKDGMMSLGNNRRLKNVIRRAQAGEEITLATIGGSITEGAGAKTYQECYASRFAQGFTARYGAGDGSNVRLVNAGVGGTASTFGLMRYQRDIVDRVQDADGLPDLVIVEFSVNDYQEPTGHRCFESLVKTILSQPNEPAVILLFAVFQDGFNLQDELKKVGETYDLMMVSVKDAAYPHVGKEWTAEEFFFDEYHPTSFGHGVMADCLLAAVAAADAAEINAQDIDLNVKPAYGTDYMGLITLYGDGRWPDDVTVERGGFLHDDTQSYTNLPIGRVCGKNFCHFETDPAEPLRVSGKFKKLLIAWRATSEARFGTAEIVVDGKVKRTLTGGEGKWGQSEVVMIWDSRTEAEDHVLEIRMAEGAENKRFTITAIGIVQ